MSTNHVLPPTTYSCNICSAFRMEPYFFIWCAFKYSSNNSLLFIFFLLVFPGYIPKNTSIKFFKIRKHYKKNVWDNMNYEDNFKQVFHHRSVFMLNDNTNMFCKLKPHTLIVLRPAPLVVIRSHVFPSDQVKEVWSTETNGVKRLFDHQSLHTLQTLNTNQTPLTWNTPAWHKLHTDP